MAGENHTAGTRRRALIAMAVSFVAATFSAERERWPLWVPVLFGGGAAVYLALPWEPPGIWAQGPVIACVVLGLWLFRRRGFISVILVAFLAVFVGFAGMVIRTELVSAPKIERATVFSGLQGRVVSREAYPDGARVVLGDLRIPRLPADAVPATLRIKLRRDDRRVRVGDWIEVTARVGPPPIPAYPGAYDFSRAAWFRGLGGVGFAFTKSKPIAAHRHDTIVEVFWRRVESARLVLADLFAEVQGWGMWGNVATGGVATALVIGDRSGVPEPVRETLRVSGLAHLLAISGLHIGLAAGAVFVGLRALLAFWSRLAVRYPIKKWAAIAAILAAFGYLLLSGGTVPTQRAFIMVGLVMLAVLLDRQAISMRLVAVAAAVVLLFAPEEALSAGFQMSFGAVAALVAVFERSGSVRQSLADREGPLSVLGEGPRRIFLYIAILSLTTVVATAATAPFALYHFGRVANFGLLANLLAVPVMAFWVMPLGLLAVLLAPVGLGEVPAVAMGWGIEVILAVAAEISSWPRAATLSGQMPDWGLAIAVVGGLWLVIWRRRWRRAGLPLVALGLLSPLSVNPPNVVIADSGKLTAIRWDGGLWLSSTRRERFAAGVWSEKIGVPIKGDWRDLAHVPHTPLRCGPMGCVYSRNGVSVAFAEGSRGVAEDCRLTEVTVAPNRAPRGVCDDRILIGPIERAHGGAHIVTLSIAPSPPHIETVADRRGWRPWTGPKTDIRKGNAN